MTIPTQKEWVEGCLAYYKETDYQPGNPEDGEWHECHYPVPRCLGGTKTILLLKEHHAVQGVLQSEEFQHCSIYGWEKEFLTGELLDICAKWLSDRSVRARKEWWGKLSPKERSVFCSAIRAKQTPESRRAHREKLRQATLALPPEWREQMKKIKTETHGKQIEITTPEGEKLLFPALREASRQTGLHPDVLRRLCRGGAPTRQGHTARFL